MDGKKTYRSGFELMEDLSELVTELDSIEDEDEESYAAWFDSLNALLAEAGDKVLAYRLVISLAKKRQEFFAEERNRYARRFRAQGRIVDSCKGLAHTLLTRNHELTGKKKLLLEDGTWASLITTKSFRFRDAMTGSELIDPSMIPKRFVKIEVSKSALKDAAKRDEVIPGVTYEKVDKTHVRWS
jgi:hypothetical protein